MSKGMRRHVGTGVIAWIILIIASIAMSQTTSPTTEPTTQPATHPTTATTQTIQIFSLDGLSERTETTTTTLSRVLGELASGKMLASLQERLSELMYETSSEQEEVEKLLTSAPSLDTLRTLEQEWNDLRKRLAAVSTDLSARASALQRDDQRLADLGAAWQRTMEDVRQAGESEDSEVARRVQAFIQQIAQTRSALSARAGNLRILQSRATTQDWRIAEVLAAITEAQDRAVDRLFDRDSEPLWSGRFGAEAQKSFARDGGDSFTRQWTATWGYIQRNIFRFAIHGVLILVLASLARRAHARWGAQLQSANSETARSGAIFQMPVASAVVATLLLVRWLYPQAPRLLMVLLVGAMFIAVLAVLRRVVQKSYVPLLHALAVFYVMGLAVSVTDSMPAVSRGLFLLTMIAGSVAMGLFLLRTRRPAQTSDTKPTAQRRLIRPIVVIAMIIFAAAALANVLGFVGLSRLLGDGVLASGYIAMMLDACVRVIHALIVVALHAHPLASLGIVRRHTSLIQQRLMLILAVLATLWWALLTLDAFSIRRMVMGWLEQFLTARFGVGAVSLSLGGVIAFCLSLGAAFLLSRFIRFLLDEDVYPRVSLARGVPYAISTLLHYVILFLGFVTAVAALGYDMTKFTILAGAFGVGLGFGMQNIVNNFVSGLILLFERPIQVGDVIELDAGTVGVVSRIGIRATVVRTDSAAEVIVPNGLLIANRVINWTLTNRQKGFEVSVAIGPGAQPQRVIDLLLQIAGDSPCVARTPPPQAFMTDFLPGGGMKFELRVRTNTFADWTRAKSDLLAAINIALAKESIQRG